MKIIRCKKCENGVMEVYMGSGGKEWLRCNMCGNEEVREAKTGIDYWKDYYDSPEEWAEEVIRCHSYHEEIPKEYLDRLKACKTWEDVETLSKEVVPYLKR